MRWRLLSNSTQLQTPLTAAGQVHSERTHLYLEIESGGLFGYGEVSPQPRLLNGDPGLAEVLEEWHHHLGPTFSQIVAREGVLPAWFRAPKLAASRPASATASTMLEMALLDLQLKVESRSLTDFWNQRFDTPVQVVASSFNQDLWPTPQKSERLRVKVGADSLSESSLLQLGKQNCSVILDFNCAAASIDDVVKLYGQATEATMVHAIEQPFAPGNLAEQTLLSRLLDCQLSLDEGVRSLTDVTLIARHSAASLLCIKPARVGGYSNARALITKAHELGLATYIGGFFESPLGRRVNSTFAKHLTNEPSDIGAVTVAEKDADLWVPEEVGLGLRPSAELLNGFVEVSRSTI